MVATQRGVELRVLGQQLLTGEVYLEYWLWRCRANQMDLSVHPLRGYNKADLKHEGSLKETQEWPTTETEKKY